MYISTSQVLTSSNISVPYDSNSDYSLNDLVSRSFSEAYVSNGTTSTFNIQMDVSNLGYIAIAGHDMHTKGVVSVDFRYYNGSNYVTEKSYALDWDATIFHLVQNNATSYMIRINKSSSSDVISVGNVAAGDAFELPNNGERAGYRYQWTMPAIKARTQTMNGMPTSSVLQTMQTSGVLTVPDILTSDVRDTWQAFQKFAISNGCYICEDTSRGEESYYAFNVKPNPTTAHSSTRALQNASIRFDAWTGNV